MTKRICSIYLWMTYASCLYFIMSWTTSCLNDMTVMKCILFTLLYFLYFYFYPITWTTRFLVRSVLFIFLVFCVVWFFLVLGGFLGGVFVFVVVVALLVFLLCPVYPIFPVSLGCPCLVCLSVFSNVYSACWWLCQRLHMTIEKE